MGRTYHFISLLHDPVEGEGERKNASLGKLTDERRERRERERERERERKRERRHISEI